MKVVFHNEGWRQLDASPVQLTDSVQDTIQANESTITLAIAGSDNGFDIRIDRLNLLT